MAVYTVFGQPANPGSNNHDTAQYTMGMQFTLSQPAALTGIWWWSPTGALVLPGGTCIYQITGTNTGTQVTGTLHGSPTWGGATAGSGWVKETYDGSVTLSASTNYRVCILWTTATSDYTATANYWSSGPGGSGITSGIITAPNSGSADGGNQDAFIVGSGTFAYPNTSFNSGNYWVDVEVTTGGPAPGPNVVGSNVPEAAATSGWVMLPVRGRVGSAV